MKFKKFLALTLSLCFIGSALVGCGSKSSNATTGGKNNSTDQTNNGNKITLRYAAWDLGTEEELTIFEKMIEKYEELNPNVDIVIADDIANANWIESLTTAAAGGNLPDVFMASSLPDTLSNDWALDISQYVSNDEDWSNIPEYLVESTKYGNGVYAIPYAMHLGGFYINEDLFNSKNQTPLNYGYTFDEFVNAIKNMSYLNEGIVSLRHSDFVDWYPAVKNEGMGWFTYDGEKVNLADTKFIEGVKFSQEISKGGYAFSGLTDEQKGNFGVTEDWEAWNAGKIAFSQEPTYVSEDYSKLPFKTKFIGLPDGKTFIVPDYIFVSKTSKNPEEAYKFAKFMSFSKEGILAKLDAIEENQDLKWSSLPLNTDEEIITRFFSNYPVEGVEEVYKNLNENSFVEGFKYIPGYVKARFEAPTGISAEGAENATIAQVINACIKGELNIDDYAAQLNDLANQNISDISSKIDSVLAK